MSQRENACLQWSIKNKKGLKDEAGHQMWKSSIPNLEQIKLHIDAFVQILTL